MERIELQTGLSLSRIIYGMWRLADDTDTSASHVQAKIEACLQQGIPSFAQADIYGDYACEKLLGAALKETPSLRDQMQIITKCDINLLSNHYPERRVKHYDTSAEHIKASVDASLKNMSIDRIDVLLLHRPDPLMDAVETANALDELIASGKIKSVGVSNYMHWDWTLLQSALQAKLVTNQIELSLLENQYFSDGTVAYLQERGIPPMAWSPLGGGRLFDESSKETAELRKALAASASNHSVDIDAIAVAWLLRHPSRIMPVMGTNNLSRIEQLSKAFDVTMSREEWFELLQAANGVEVA